MQIQSRPMGPYQTNCYILTVEGKDLIIDPGMGATEWILEQIANPVAILNTHGHFDHVWSNAELQEVLDVPLYCPAKDAFMLSSDPLGRGMPPSIPDVHVADDESLEISGIPVLFRHFPGHTPGCSVIEVGDLWLSGDFLFRSSVGRWDFPYSSAKEMQKSLKKAADIEGDYTLYPGHGSKTTLKREQHTLPYWIEEIQRREEGTLLTSG